MRECDIVINKEILFDDQSLNSQTIKCIESKLNFIFDNFINDPQLHVYLKKHITTIPLFNNMWLYEIDEKSFSGIDQMIATKLKITIQDNIAKLSSLKECPQVVQDYFNRINFENNDFETIDESVPAFVFSFNVNNDIRNFLTTENYSAKITSCMNEYFSNWLKRCNQLEKTLISEFSTRYYRVDTKDESLCHHIHFERHGGPALNLWDIYSTPPLDAMWKHGKNYELKREEIEIIQGFNFIYVIC